MIKIINIFSFLLLTTFLHAQTEEAATPVKGDLDITINVPNAPSDKGKILYALYTEKNFLGDPVLSSAAKIKDGKSTTRFNGVSAGTYAVIIFHDSNDNGKLDMDEYGMPKENFALSNNPRSMGPPQFQNAKFTLDKSMALEIKL